MKTYWKWMPLVIALCSCAIFAGLVGRSEHVLRQGQSIYVSLRPVDPRSILQGDYMALDYELFTSGALPNAEHQSTLPLAYVRLDTKGRVAETRFTPHGFTQGGAVHALQLKHVPHSNRFYPAARSYLFAEGLASCYSKAAFAEFKVMPSGQSVLASLTDSQLGSLNCEQYQAWSQGVQQDQ